MVAVASSYYTSLKNKKNTLSLFPEEEEILTHVTTVVFGGCTLGCAQNLLSTQEGISFLSI